MPQRSRVAPLRPFPCRRRVPLSCAEAAAVDRRRNAVGPDGFAGFEVHHRERALVLRVADEGPRRNVLGVARFGDVVRHVRAASALGALDDEDEDVRPSGESCRSVADWRSASSNFGSARAFSFSSAFFFFSASMRVCSISFSSSALTNFWLSVSRGSRFFGRDVGELRQLAAVERHEEQVVVAREGDRRLAPRPARAGFGAGRPRDLAARAADRVEQHDVALVGEQDAAVRLVPHAADRRRAPASSSDSLRGSPPSRPTTQVDGSSSPGRRHSK